MTLATEAWMLTCVAPTPNSVLKPPRLTAPGAAYCPTLRPKMGQMVRKRGQWFLPEKCIQFASIFYF